MMNNSTQGIVVSDIGAAAMDDDNSCELCGWLSAFFSMLAFGSFGVPIKSPEAKAVDIDPLVFQSYKTFMCFLTSWIVLLAGQPFRFTPWGIVSGLFWVPGGVATVYAVKNAGLALGVGIGSSCIVIVSFVWGIFIFREPVQSKFMACVAVLLIILGILGMSYFANNDKDSLNNETENDDASSQRGVAGNQNYHKLRDDDQETQSPSGGHHNAVPETNVHDPLVATESSTIGTEDIESTLEDQQSQSLTSLNQSGMESDEDMDDASCKKDGRNCVEDEATVDSATIATDANDSTEPQVSLIARPRQESAGEQSIDRARCCENLLTRLPAKYRGMLAAVFCGFWGGSILVPMAWCPASEHTKGVGYLLSFALGASIVTCGLWVLRWLMNIIRYQQSPLTAYHNLPSFHVRTMWRPGALSGLLWSIGNFFSLLSVYYLGEGVGYPLVQTAILVNGLWGIFYFQEVKGGVLVRKWFASAMLTVTGILLLSYEHHKS